MSDEREPWSMPQNRSLSPMNDTQFKSTVIAALTKIETKLERALADNLDHEKRIRSLEIWRWGMVGGIGVVIWLIGQISSHIK